MKTKILAAASILGVVFLFGILAGMFIRGEWKPVGDGASIVHTRTGEVRPTDSPGLSKLIPMRFRGAWKPVDPSETETITIGIGAFLISRRGLYGSRPYEDRFKCEVVEAKDNWVILRGIRAPGNFTAQFRLETVSDDSILCSGLSTKNFFGGLSGGTKYTRVNATD